MPTNSEIWVVDETGYRKSGMDGSCQRFFRNRMRERYALPSSPTGL